MTSSFNNLVLKKIIKQTFNKKLNKKWNHLFKKISMKTFKQLLNLKLNFFKNKINKNLIIKKKFWMKVIKTKINSLQQERKNWKNKKQP